MNNTLNKSMIYFRVIQSTKLIVMEDNRYLKFYCEPNSDEYKGFRIVGAITSNSNETRMSFSNGYKSFEVSGVSLEKAYSHAFDIIDMEP